MTFSIITNVYLANFIKTKSRHDRRNGCLPFAVIVTMTEASTSYRRRRRNRSPSPEEFNAFLAAERAEEETSEETTAAKRLRREREEILQQREETVFPNSSATSFPDANAIELLEEKQLNAVQKGEDGESERGVVQSLLEEATLLKDRHAASLVPPLDDEAGGENNVESSKHLSKRVLEEQRILKEASKVQTNALQARSELAKGLIYTESLKTSWPGPPRYIIEQGIKEYSTKVREKWHILVEGEDIDNIPPLRNFAEMKFPESIVKYLEGKNIKRPTPIQMQGLPVALSGRDMIGIAFTGSGKTLTFSLPLVMAALEEEKRMPIVGGEGPVGFILGPSRELARQTYDVVTGFCEAIEKAGGPKLHSQLLIGGENARTQLEPIREHGVHCIVATPGRLRDFLGKKQITLDICRYACLDESDRLLDLGFDEEVGEIMNHFHRQRQTLLFSATFPKKFQDFARETLVRPVVVNVGRAVSYFSYFHRKY